MIRSDLRSTAPTAVPKIKAMIGGADVAITDLESVVAEPGQPNDSAPRVAPSGFLTPPGALESLQEFGFNLVALVNNHAFDLGVPGVLNGLKNAERLGLAHAGTGKTLTEAAAPGILKTSHGTVAMVALSSGLVREGAMATATQPGINELRVGPGNVPNEEDAKRILQSIRDATTKADLVVVYQHNHVFDRSFTRIFANASPERLRPAEWLKKWVHAEIDAGADLVLMHGAPLLHGIEIYKGKAIFYDLGNFMFNAPFTMWNLEEPITWQSVVATVEYQGKRVQSIKLRPVVLNFIGDGVPEAHDAKVSNEFMHTRGLPAPAEGELGGDILQRMVEMSEPFGTKIVVTGLTAEVQLGGGR